MVNKRPVRLGAISFINTLPMYHNTEVLSNTQILYGSPTELNEAVNHGVLNISPVSSAFYLQNTDRLVMLNDLSVSSLGAVESVLLLSDKPLEELGDTEIGIPDDSATSVILLAYLLEKATGKDCRQNFKIYPAQDYKETLDTLGHVLIIGDKALEITAEGLPKGYQAYDLSRLWVEETGLPFVFAVWVAGRDWAESHPLKFRQINKALVENKEAFFNDPVQFMAAMASAREKCQINDKNIYRYLRRSLSYDLSLEHREALQKFSGIIHAFRKHPIDYDRLEPKHTKRSRSKVHQ